MLKFFVCISNRPFYTGPTSPILGGYSVTPRTNVSHGPNVDDDNNISSRRRVKRFVKARIRDNVEIGLCNETLEVENEMAMNP